MDARPLLMAFLRERTQEQHTAIESSPFFAALAAGHLPRARYVELLRALAIVHEALEAGLSRSADPAVRAVLRPEDARLPLLLRDLRDAGFEARDVERDGGSPALLHAEVLAERIRGWADDDPAALLGCVYVMGGSVLGGPFVAAMVTRGLAAEGPVPLAYLTNDARPPGDFWRGFTDRMNAAALDPADMERAAAAAGATFEAIGEVLWSLAAGPPGDTHTGVRSLNPDAGRHPITTDLREVRAALRAGAASWRRNPYFERRYGDRGRRFTRSDSAWLAMLTQLSDQYVQDQIAWLGRVLSARGMPRLLLEEHLLLLHRELCAAVPERASEYGKLSIAAERLRAERLARLPEETFESLAADFEARVRPLSNVGVGDMGRLLVAAVTDEAAGIDQAVPSLEAWAADQKLFPAPWIEAVHATLSEARRLAGAAPPAVGRPRARRPLPASGRAR